MLNAVDQIVRVLAVETLVKRERLKAASLVMKYSGHPALHPSGPPAAILSKGSKTPCAVPSRYGVFNR